MLKVEGNKVSSYSIKIWRVHVWLMYCIIYSIGLFILFLSFYKEWDNWISNLIILLLMISLVFNFLEIKFIIPLRYKYFRYVIKVECILIREGGIFKKNTIIPTNKIYYVNRKSGPLLEKYSLENIVLGTLAGEYVIPCLSKDKADKLQQEIINICEIREYKEEQT